MQEKRNIRLVISLVILVIITTLTAMWGGDEERIAVDKEIFRVPDFKTINRVVLESPKEKIELAFNGSRWTVNEKYDADRSMIQLLFATLQQAEPKRPIAQTLRDSAAKVLEKTGVKVSLFEGANVRQAFFAGGNSSKTQAWFHHPDEDDSYYMIIPGYRDYVSGILELDESGWRDKFIFGFNWRNFKGLEVTFPGHAEENFSVAMANGVFGIPGITKVDTAKLNTFLDDVSLLTADRFVSRAGLRDSLLRGKPVMEIAVTDIADRRYTLSLFTPATKSSDVAGLTTGEVVFFDRRVVGPLLKPRTFFIAK